MRATRESEEYQRGILVELQVYSWLAKTGIPVSRVRHGGDIAPALTVWERRVPLPDIQAHLAAGAAWIEVKSKTTCGTFELAGFRTTGIDTDRLRDYREVEEVTLHPVYVVFVHKNEREVRWARATDQWIAGVGRGRDMSYLEYDVLPFFADYDDVMEAETVVPLAADHPLFSPVQIQLRLGTP